ncbi:GNAT family acetyltransferase [Methylobacterium oryzisoli]|uniref:GNAT family acetyltransferase n=1 Tax=Methylobacterium oryzisoli TaxID=3385502 RepID=UPI00389256D5
MFKVRCFEESDKESVIRLWELVFPGEPSWNDPLRAIERKVQAQRETFIIAEDLGAVIGTAMAGDDGYRGWVYYVAVHPDYRLQGVGRELMKAVEQALSDLGCPQLNLLVRNENISVSGFYKKLGYQTEEKICMAKIL